VGHDAAPAPAFVVVEAEEGGAATVVVAADVDGVVEGVAAAVAVVVGAALFEPHADTRAMSEATIAVERRGNEMVVTDAPPGPESDDLDRCLGRSAMRMRKPLTLVVVVVAAVAGGVAALAPTAMGGPRRRINARQPTSLWSRRVRWVEGTTPRRSPQSVGP